MDHTAGDRAARRLVPLAALSLVLVVPGYLALRSAPDVTGSPPLTDGVAFVFVLLLFVLTEAAQFHVEVQKFAHSVSLSDLPLVIGLFLIDPEQLLAARLLSGGVGFAVRNLSAPKVAFNISLLVAEVGLATALLAALAGAAGAGPQTWAAVVVVVVAVDLLDSLAVIAAITALQGPMALADAARMVVETVVCGLMCTALALMFLPSLQQSPAAVVLLAVVAACLTLGYRAYAGLFARHEDLSTLHEGSQQMAAAGGLHELNDRLVEHAKRVARAGGAALVPVQERGSDRMLTGATGRTLQSGTRDPAERAWLEQHRHEDALIVPVTSGGEPLGTLVVTDRTGSTRTFTDEDLRRLQMLSSHAEALWANGRLLEKLRHDAYHDELTGLPNRPGFMQTLAARLEGAEQHLGASGQPSVRDSDRCEAALLLFDLDRFREVNDTLGHPVGDRLLVLLAERFRTLAPAGATVARLGGDEFAVLLPQTASRQEVRRTAEELRAGVGAALHLSGTRLETTAAVGMAVVPQDGAEATTLLRRADVAMYAAKHAGGVSWYRPEDDTNSIDRLSMLADLRKAIEDGDLMVSFQPQYSLDTREVVGFEALARWSHPDRGDVRPDTFVAMAELGGIARMLTVSVLRQSLEQCRGWLSALPDTRISVNLSPRLTADPDLPALVAEMLDEAGVPARLLVLELTETSLVPNGGSSVQGLHELRSLGVGLSVDDFGTGYSSLAYLKSLPVTELKIDKAFVIPMRDEPYSQAIIGSVVSLSHQLGLTVVAEGIEDDETRGLVAATGCDVGQGFGLARPIPSTELAAWIDGQTGRASRTVLLPPSALPGQGRTLGA